MQLTNKATRIIQYGISAITVLISGLLLKKNSSISSVVDELNELTGSHMNLSDTSASNILMTASGSSTLADKGIVYLSSLLSNTKTQTNNGRLTFKTLGYMGGVITGEVAEYLMWYSSMVISMIKNGDVSCGDTASLLNSYNLTNTRDLELNSFFDGNLTELIPSYDFDGSSNVTVALKQAELILKLSQHCQFNKATIGLSAVNFFVYIITSGVTVGSFVTFYRAYKNSEEDTELEMMILSCSLK